MRVRNLIPNLLTVGNAACGLVVIILLTMPPDRQWHVGLIAILLVVAMACDFFDGFVARALKATSELGKQLDSLSDLITFGVVPGIMVYLMIYEGLWGHNSYFASDIYVDGALAEEMNQWGANKLGWVMSMMPWSAVILPFAGLLIPVFSAWRLAKFNIDTRQSYGFLGLPTPANALFFYGIFFIFMGKSRGTIFIPHRYYTYDQFKFTGIELYDPFHWLYDPFVLAALSLVFSILLVTEIPLLAMKFKDYSIKNNWPRYALILLSITLLAILWFRAIPLIIVLYFICSFLETAFNRNKT
jgi:CDP-diacylglycerol---serine O-phosphatidyltransferase